MPDDGFRRAEACQQGIERSVMVALGKATVVLGHDERHMRVCRMPVAQKILHIHLLRRRAQKIDAAHDRGHALFGIVDDDSELVGERPIGAPDKEVSAIGGKILFVTALDKIVERIGLRRNDQTLRRRTDLLFFGTLHVGKMPTRTRVNELFPVVRRRCRMEVGTRAVARIHQVSLAQLLESLAIDVVAVMLEIRAFIPEKAQGFEVTLHCVDVFRFRPLGIPAKYYDLMQKEKPELLAENVNMRSTMLPPEDFATSQATKAENTFPACIRPVGEGAKRPFKGVVETADESADKPIAHQPNENASPINAA